MTRATMWALLAVVAAAAAVLSFDALRDLAVLCGFSPRLAWLLPVVIDAGAAAGCLAWLRPGGEISQLQARTFARTLTVVLLASSVAGNGIVHYLGAYTLVPPWWLVVAVSAVAPAVLGAVVHLAVLVGRPDREPTPDSDEPAELDASPLPMGNIPAERDPAAVPAVNRGTSAADRTAELVASGAGRGRLARELNISQHAARRLLEQTTNHTDTRSS